ncbi:MAG: hypothetical protein J0L93_04770 [Deltaproteobacteria bacterium]|nr:hypothetical protein [Deltaproteobacteria bacterium]
MKSISLSVFLGLFLFSGAAFSQEFYTKNSDGSIAKIKINFHLNDDLSLTLQNPEVLEKYSADPASIKKDKIIKREPTEAEKIADVAVMLLTSLMVMSTHNAYDISSDLRLDRVAGLFFFILPFEINDIYRKCGEQQYLVAISDAPDAETSKQLKSVDEILKLCNPKTSEPS